MARLLIILAVAVIAWRLLMGRWPWQKRLSARDKALSRARTLLAVSPGATRSEVISAHRRLITAVHPDRGGTAGQVHDADAARDLLLANLPPDQKESA